MIGAYRTGIKNAMNALYFTVEQPSKAKPAIKRSLRFPDLKTPYMAMTAAVKKNVKVTSVSANLEKVRNSGVKPRRSGATNETPNPNIRYAAKVTKTRSAVAKATDVAIAT
jgi:hypothetical protein